MGFWFKWEQENLLSKLTDLYVYIYARFVTYFDFHISILVTKTLPSKNFKKTSILRVYEKKRLRLTLLNSFIYSKDTIFWEKVLQNSFDMLSSLAHPLCKVQTFWEAHKNLCNLPHALDIYLVNVQTMRKIFFQIFCSTQKVQTFKTASFF